MGDAESKVWVNEELAQDQDAGFLELNLLGSQKRQSSTKYELQVFPVTNEFTFTYTKFKRRAYDSSVWDSNWFKYNGYIANSDNKIEFITRGLDCQTDQSKRSLTSFGTDKGKQAEDSTLLGKEKEFGLKPNLGGISQAPKEYLNFSGKVDPFNNMIILNIALPFWGSMDSQIEFETRSDVVLYESSAWDEVKASRKASSSSIPKDCNEAYVQRLTNNLSNVCETGKTNESGVQMPSECQGPELGEVVSQIGAAFLGLFQPKEAGIPLPDTFDEEEKGEGPAMGMGGGLSPRQPVTFGVSNPETWSDANHDGSHDFEQPKRLSESEWRGQFASQGFDDEEETALEKVSGFFNDLFSI